MNQTTQCGGLYGDEELFAFLPQPAFKQYLELKSANEVLALRGILENYHSCPFCNRYGVQLEDSGITNINCPLCHKDWCIQCNRNKHPGELCGVIRIVDSNLKDAEIKIRKEVTDTITNVVMKKCPSCRVPYIKDGGCNAMTCNSCKKHSCYICQIIISSDDYGHGHFREKGVKCELFSTKKQMDDNDINKKKIDDALKVLLSKQIDNNIRIIMQKEINFQLLIPNKIESGCIGTYGYGNGAIAAFYGCTPASRALLNEAIQPPNKVWAPSRRATCRK